MTTEQIPIAAPEETQYVSLPTPIEIAGVSSLPTHRFSYDVREAASLVAGLTGAFSFACGLLVLLLHHTTPGLGLLLLSLVFLTTSAYSAPSQSESVERAADLDGPLPVLSPEERWEALRAEHLSLEERYAAFEEDLSAVLRLPALTDSSVAQTGAFLEAFHALSLFPLSSPTSHEDVDRYEERVTRACIAWRTAREHAEKSGTRLLPAEDRRRIEKAQSLLALAGDPAASDFERTQALQRVRDLLDGLITIPAHALASLEASIRREITRSQ